MPANCGNIFRPDRPTSVRLADEHGDEGGGVRLGNPANAGTPIHGQRLASFQGGDAEALAKNGLATVNDEQCLAGDKLLIDSAPRALPTASLVRTRPRPGSHAFRR